jgi:hypothetical protein
VWVVLIPADQRADLQISPVTNTSKRVSTPRTQYNLNFSNLNDADGSIWARYNVPWQPAYVFYRADGSSTFVNDQTAAMPLQELSDRVAALS